EILCSSRMMSMHSSTHSSQMNTVGPAMSFLTSCWLFPQNEQYSVLLESPLAALVIVRFSLLRLRRTHVRQRPARGRSRHQCRICAAGCLILDIPRSAPGSQAFLLRSDKS